MYFNWLTDALKCFRFLFENYFLQNMLEGIQCISLLFDLLMKFLLLRSISLLVFADVNIKDR